MGHQGRIWKYKRESGQLSGEQGSGGRENNCAGAEVLRGGTGCGPNMLSGLGSSWTGCFSFLTTGKSELARSGHYWGGLTL